MKRLLGMGYAYISLCAVLLIACGDDDGGSTITTCEAFTPCGGDVVGQWQLDGMCLDGLDMLLGDIVDKKGCENFFGGARLRPEGTFTFGGDSTLMTTGASFAFDLDVLITNTCASALAGTTATVTATSCNAFESNLSQEGSTIEGASCSLGARGCACTVSSVRMAIDESGQYMLSGTNLVDSSGSSPYCVSGDTLSIRSTAAMGTGTLILHRK